MEDLDATSWVEVWLTGVRATWLLAAGVQRKEAVAQGGTENILDANTPGPRGCVPWLHRSCYLKVILTALILPGGRKESLSGWFDTHAPSAPGDLFHWCLWKPSLPTVIKQNILKITERRPGDSSSDLLSRERGRHAGCLSSWATPYKRQGWPFGRQRE